MGLFKRKSPEEKAAAEARRRLVDVMRLSGGQHFFILAGTESPESLHEMSGWAKEAAPLVFADQGHEGIQDAVDEGEQRLRQLLKQHDRAFAREGACSPEEAVIAYHKWAEAVLADWSSPGS